VSLLVLAAAGSAAAAERATPVARVDVHGHREDTRAKLEHIQKEVDGTKLTVTRKSSITRLDHVPTLVGQDPRELFARTPGVLANDTGAPNGIALAYRGLGAAPGAQGVLVLQDGLPIEADFVAAPTLDWLPLPQGLAEVQTLRGGSSLVYGPETAAINFVSRRPEAGEPLSASTEQVGGSNGLWSSFNTVEGSRGAFDYRADLGWIRTDGERRNGRSTTGQAGAWLGWRPAKGQLWYLDLQADRVSAGEPGPMGLAQYKAAPDAATTPDDHLWLDRYAATLGSELDLGRGWLLEAKLRAAYEALDQRAAGPTAAPVPGAVTLQDSLYRTETLDMRLRKRWGHGNALTFGVEAFHDDAPLRQWTGLDPSMHPGDHAGALARLNQARTSDYQSVFVENVFRLPERMHLVPSVRLEHEAVGVDETVRPAGLTRPLIHASADRWVPLFGLGFGNDFGRDNETYFSVTQGWRPLRFFDLASPFTDTQPRSTADLSRSLSWEAGVHGTPVKGLFYDASLFWISVKNRVETQALNALEQVAVNTGDTRSRGFEGELVYDFLAGRADRTHLSAFGSLALLDARFVRSDIPGRVGRVPAFAPHVLAKAGVTWRRDGAWDLSLAGVSVGSQDFQDSDQAAGAGAAYVPARMPGYVVFDLTGDWQATRRIRLLAGVKNLGDARYWAQATQIGITPAPRRTVYAGLALGF
jgi:Fe(3+) dicitrate transport protein